MALTKQGVRDLNVPQANRRPKRHGTAVSFCRHVDVRYHDARNFFPYFECRTCGTTWEDDGFGYPARRRER